MEELTNSETLFKVSFGSLDEASSSADVALGLVVVPDSEMTRKHCAAPLSAKDREMDFGLIREMLEVGLASSTRTNGR